MTDIVEIAQAETVVTSEREPTFGETLQSAASFCESLKRQGSADQWDFDYLIGKFRDAAFAVSLWDKAREGWLAEIASQARRIAELEDANNDALAAEAKLNLGYGAGVEKVGVRANDIVHRLNVKADMLTMGERIAWGSDSAIMREAAAEIEKLRGALSDLLSWFPDKPTEPEWRIKAGGHGADDAITEARATLTTGGTHD